MTDDGQCDRVGRPPRLVRPQTSLTNAGYCAIRGSALTNMIPSATDCARRIRSNGSLCSGGKATAPRRMGTGYRQFRIPMIQQAPAQQPRVGLKILPPQAGLYRDFPDTRRPEQKLVSGIGDQGMGNR